MFYLQHMASNLHIYVEKYVDWAIDIGFSKNIMTDAAVLTKSTFCNRRNRHNKHTNRMRESSRLVAVMKEPFTKLMSAT